MVNTIKVGVDMIIEEIEKKINERKNDKGVKYKFYTKKVKVVNSVVEHFVNKGLSVVLIDKTFDRIDEEYYELIVRGF